MFCMIKPREIIFNYRKHRFKNTFSCAAIILYDTAIFLPRLDNISKALVKGLCHPTRFYTARFYNLYFL